MTYNWLALIVFFAGVISINITAKKLLFKIPALNKMREINREQDSQKKAKDKYPPAIHASNMAGLAGNVLFLFFVAPFLFTLEPLPIWRYVTDIVLILMIYDFFYYLTHRFLFHGTGYFRRVHGLHHQARNPSFVDSFYVHPLETFIGLALLGLTITGVSLWLGPLHVGSMIVLYMIYTQQNIINHTYFDLDYFPYKTINYLTDKHHTHHKNMNMGNYASITPLYDYLFGTLD